MRRQEPALVQAKTESAKDALNRKTPPGAWEDRIRPCPIRVGYRRAGGEGFNGFATFLCRAIWMGNGPKKSAGVGSPPERDEPANRVCTVPIEAAGS
jgi:hypothetical protein